MKSSQIPSKNLPMVGTTMVGHIHIMIIELLMKLDVILKNVGCTVTKMLYHNTIIYLAMNKPSYDNGLFVECPYCHEAISYKASVCNHCNKDISPK